jgi:hypothetical protein
VTDTPDYAQIAHDLGLRRVTYPILEAFDHLSVGKTYGWQLVKTGRLPVVRLAPKKIIVKAVDVARLIHEGIAAPPSPSQGPAGKSRRSKGGRSPFERRTIETQG